MKRILAWFEARLNLRDTVGPMLMHPIPRSAAGPMGWWYVFGSASITLLMIQILTGIGLAMVYVPTADQAYESLVYLNEQQPLGWFLRSLHYWSGSAMVVMVVVHMTQVYLHGAFKYPRELNWLTGVLLLLMTLGMAFSGQILRWDADAYWGVGVGASMAGRVPVLGPYIVDLLLGGPVIGADTLSRFFALHVFVIPGLLLTFMAVHLWLVLKRGISEPPVPGKIVDPATYPEQYEAELKKGVPFFGEAMLKDAFFSSLTVIVVVVFAAIAGPKGPGALPEPALLGRESQARLAVLVVVRPAVAEPARRGDLHHPGPAGRADRRPAAGAVRLQSRGAGAEPTAGGGALRHRDLRRDRRVDAPRGYRAVVARHGGLERRRRAGGHGAGKHAGPAPGGGRAPEQAMPQLSRPGRRGGRRGPDLSGVGIRLTRDQLIDQISNGTPGGGNMPAYGKQIRPAEMSALVEFLVGLRPKGQEPARPAAVSPP